jgi:hypothetical protein
MDNGFADRMYVAKLQKDVAQYKEMHGKVLVEYQRLVAMLCGAISHAGGTLTMPLATLAPFRGTETIYITAGNEQVTFTLTKPAETVTPPPLPPEPVKKPRSRMVMRDGELQSDA